jgi:hypothetical protein
MKKTILLILLTSFFIGCAGPSKIMSSWVGKTKADLYQSWGPPGRVTDDGQGGEILIYSATVNMGQTPGQVYNNGNGGVNYTAPQSNYYSKTRMFYVNSNGVIYSWRWQGL